MALDNEMKCIQAISKLDDEARERVLEYVAKKWPKQAAKAVAGGVVGTVDLPPRGKGG